VQAVLEHRTLVLRERIRGGGSDAPHSQFRVPLAKLLPSQTRLPVLSPRISLEVDPASANGVRLLPPAGYSSYAAGDRDAAFAYDGVLPPAATQEAVYAKCAAPLVAAALGGVNSTVIMYGQTGSGKTFTMLGDGGAGNNAGAGSHCLGATGLGDAGSDAGGRVSGYARTRHAAVA
jgi:hypothetical protein